MHTYRMFFSTNSCYMVQKNVWPLVDNVASVQNNEMNGQTSVWRSYHVDPGPHARTPPPPPPTPPQKKGPPNGTVKDFKRKQITKINWWC